MKKPTTRNTIRIVLLIVFVCANRLYAQDIVGKITVGYQGWFACPNDGSPINVWWHWTQNWAQKPSPDNKGMVSWPDVSSYDATFPTAFSNLGNGKPASLFSSYSWQTVNTHFKWMHQNGIHTAALQRFSPMGGEGPVRDSMAIRVKNAAEANAVKFYIMYDVTGWTNMQSEIKTDWTNKMSKYISSPAYAYENGKPVVVIWGFGFNDDNHPWTATVCMDVINWFKSQGCYVGGGVPTHWRNETSDSKPNFIDCYHSFDMLSPWMVGRISNISGIDNFYTTVNLPDQQDCNAHGIDYQPCILPGDLQAGHRANGNFMWRQFYNMIRVGCQGIYISMFDEYNESNQILNTADSYLTIPTNYAFVTTSHLGEYISSDFYMRLTGEGGRMLTGDIPLSETHSVPFQAPPMWYQTSFEQGFDALPKWNSTVDESVTPVNVSNITTGISKDISFLGNASLKITGTDNSAGASSCYFKVIDVNIPVDSNTNLTYLFNPKTELGKYTTLDFIMTDGTNFRDLNALDINGLSMHPATGRGIVNRWNKVSCYIGHWLKGKTIDRILIDYDHAPETGIFTTYFDNISIFNGDPDTSKLLPPFPTNPKPTDKYLFTTSSPSKLIWSAGHYDQTFSVYLSKSSIFTKTDLVSTQKDTSFNLPRLKGNTTYYWRIDQTTSDGTTMGPVWSFTTPDPYTDPYNPFPSIGAKEIDSTVTFAWSADIIDQSFRIYVGTDPLLSYTDLISTQTDTFLSYPLLNYNTTYYWRVDQTSSFGTTTGPVWTFTTKSRPLTAKYPRPIDGATNKDTSLTLTWQLGTYTKTQKLYFGTTSTLENTNLIGEPAEGSFHISGLEYGKTYYWRVDEINDLSSTKGIVWSFTTKNISGIYSLKTEKNIPLIYSNPVTDGNLLIDFGGNVNGFSGSISMTDISGRILLIKTINCENKLQLFVGNFAKGLYLFTINSQEKKFVFKVCIE